MLKPWIHEDGFSMWKLGAGIVLSFEKAILQSGVARENVNYINAHATSSPSGDLKEYKAVSHCFGQNPEVIFISLTIPTYLKSSANLHMYMIKRHPY